MEKNLLPALVLVLGLTGCKNHVVPTLESSAQNEVAQTAHTTTTSQEITSPPAHYTIEPAHTSTIVSLVSQKKTQKGQRKHAPLEALSKALIPLARVHEQYNIIGRRETENGVLLVERDPVATMLEYGVQTEALAKQRFIPGRELVFGLKLLEAHIAIGYFGNQVGHRVYLETIAKDEGYANRIRTREMIADAQKEAGKKRNEIVAPVQRFFQQRYR